MDNLKNDKYFVEKIVNDILFILDNTKNVSLEDFDSDELLNSAINFKFIQISENVNKLTDTFKKNNNTIPWSDIKGLRNKIVHDYDNVFFDVIYNTIKNDLPLLLDQIKKINIDEKI